MHTNTQDTRNCAEPLKKPPSELEARVHERTAALNQMMEALKAERQRFLDVLNVLPVYVALLTPDYHVPFANRVFLQRFGEGHGRRCFEHLFGRSEPCEVCDTYKVLTTRAPHQWEWTGPDKRNYSVFDFPFTDTDGSTLILEMGIDVTARKQAEGELAKHRNRLEELVKERTQQLEAAIAALRAEVTEREQAEKRISRQNAVLQGISRVFQDAMTCDTEEELGRSCLHIAEELTGSKFGFIGEVNSKGTLDDIAISNPGWEACQIQGQGGHGRIPMGLTVHGIYGRVIHDGKGFFTNNPATHPDSIGAPPGHPKLTAFLGAPLLYQGKTVGMVGLGNREGGYRAEDLQVLESLCVAIVQTLMRKRADHALREAQAQLKAHAQDLEKTVARRTSKLQEAVAELEHFSYAIIHDMRAPLRAMQGFADIIEDECAGCHRGSQEYFRRIRVASERMDRLITDSLNYSKAVRQELTLEPVDLGELLNGLVETYPNLQPDKADISIARDLPWVMGNEPALTQCFSNLLGNAVKFAKPGIKPQIRIWAENSAPKARLPGAQQVRVWVEDNGIGIPQDSLQSIFGMFQRLSPDTEGTGIGLAIVRKVAQRMGGEVGVESTLGQGSRFWVELTPISCPTGI